MAVAFAVVVAGCGGSHKATQPPPTPKVSLAPQLVSMRRVDGATYETVVIRTDGAGVVGEFIGEWTGVVHQQFQIGPRELGQLRHLVAIAAQTRHTPAFGTSPSTEYIIFTRGGHVLETAKGDVPRQLAALTDSLSGLIDQYS